MVFVCLFFCQSRSGLPALCSFEGDIFEHVLRRDLWVDFDCFHLFQKELPFQIQ